MEEHVAHEDELEEEQTTKQSEHRPSQIDKQVKSDIVMFIETMK